MVKFEEFQVYFLFCELQCIPWAMTSALFVLLSQSSEDILLNFLSVCSIILQRLHGPPVITALLSLISWVSADDNTPTRTNFGISVKPCTVTIAVSNAKEIKNKCRRLCKFVGDLLFHDSLCRCSCHTTCCSGCWFRKSDGTNILWSWKESGSEAKRIWCI